MEKKTQEFHSYFFNKTKYTQEKRYSFLLGEGRKRKDSRLEQVRIEREKLVRRRRTHGETVYVCIQTSER